MLVCSVCMEEKTEDCFTKRADRPCGFVSRCKACSVLATKASVNKDVTAHLARRRARYEASAEANKAKARARYASNTARMQATSAGWKQNNAERVAAYVGMRKRERRVAQPAWADTAKMLEIYVEARELTAATGILHHVDHIVPLKSKLVCGLHTEANLRVITATENMAKHNCWWPDMP